MGRMQRVERPRAVRTTDEDAAGGGLAVSVGMLVFLVGLALLFVTNAPS